MGSPIPPPAPPPMLAALDRGATLLTANQRAARTLRQAFDAHQQASGLTLWTPPEVFALDTWLPSLWHRMTVNGTQSRLLLNPIQQHALWRSIVAADREVSGLRSPDALADLAADAWSLLHLHNGSGRLREFILSTDTRAFQRWAEVFARLCLRNAYITAAELPAALAQALAEGTLPLPDAGLALVDFDALTPAHASLFDQIRQAGFAVDKLASILATSAASLYPAEDEASEIRTAAHWAKQRLDADPTTSLAIVVPNLADLRPRLDRVFAEFFPTAEFEFSLGCPLAETPFVATALDLLRWPLEPLPLESIGALLLSPFFGAIHSEEALAAAEFDAFELTAAPLLRPELSLVDLLDLLRRSRTRSPRTTNLQSRLRALHRTAAAEQMHPTQPGVDGPTQSHAGWADAFRSLLEAAGCTADSTSDAFQTRRRWESALDSLATLDFDNSRLTAPAALKALTRIARQAIFAPQSRQAPIQILGPLEPGGLPFDALWFLSADDRSWPSAASPNPLIPWHIQRDLAIPGVNPLRDTARAQTLTDRLARTAPEVVFSFARHAEDGPRRPSPLLRSLNLAGLTPPPLPAHTPLPLETFVDLEPLPPLPPHTRGGSQVLKLQAACAFRAFAEFRLHSTQPDTPTLGHDARDRGTHVHRIMQDFWTRIHSQEALSALAPHERESTLDACIEAALHDARTPHPTAWDAAYLDVQRRRLHALLNPWLDFELARPPFIVRQSEERLANVAIGPLLLDLRADRIDQTADGLLLIDYKTGSASPFAWTSDRPDEPQLPLYAVLAQSPDPQSPDPASHPPLAGVAFALLRAGDDLDLNGYADSPDTLTKRSRMNFPTLAEQVDDWHRVLTSLAHAFAEDDPIANPKLYPVTCKYCSQRILCRLDPTTLEDLALEEEESSSGPLHD